MIDLISGISVIIIAILGYYFSFIKYKENKIAFSIGLLMLIGLILRLYTSSDFFLHEWDERYHALVAKNLIDFPFKPMLYRNPVLPFQIENWPANHVWLHKQPIPLWGMALSMSFFGVNEIALRLPSIILTTIGIALTFEIGRQLFNTRVGFLAAFLYSISGVIIELSSGRIATDHIDIFFLFFIELAIFMAIKFSRGKKSIYNILCGVSIGLAILSKWLPALVVLPIWGLLLVNSKRFSSKEIVYNFLILITVTTIVFLPWQIYIFQIFPAEAIWESGHNLKHLKVVLDEQGGPFYYHFDKMRILYGELIYIPFIWFIWKALKRIKNYKRLLLLIWIIVPFIFFSFAATKMQNYTLFTAPALFIITALFWDYLYQYRNRFKQKWLIYTMLFLLIALPVRYAIERIKPFDNRDRYPQWVKEIHNLDVHDKVVLFNTKYPIETMFYTDCIAYSRIPDNRTILKLIEDGYDVQIIDDGNLDTRLSELNDIKILKTSHSKSSD